MTFVSWNINWGPKKTSQSDADRGFRCIEAMKAHMVRHQPAIACVQEVPSDFENHVLRICGADVQYIDQVKHHVAFLTTPDVLVRDVMVIKCAYPGADNRMIGCVVTTSSGFNLKVAGVHWTDRQTLSPFGWPRQNTITYMATELRAWWGGVPVVILGDFNASPFHDEIGSRCGLWAVRDHDEFGRKRSVLEDEMPPLFNPMWSHLGPKAKGRPRGTFFYKADRDTGIRWHWLDQILVSPDLVDKAGGVEILSHVGTKGVATASGAPNTKSYSDHLPVQMLLRD